MTSRDEKDTRLIDDSQGLTKSDLEFIRLLRTKMRPEVLEWLEKTPMVITYDMLAKLKKADERSTAFSLFLWAGGVLMGIIGFDKIAKWLIKLLEILGAEK